MISGIGHEAGMVKQLIILQCIRERGRATRQCGTVKTHTLFEEND
jgi:hypothetical protein